MALTRCELDRVTIEMRHINSFTHALLRVVTNKRHETLSSNKCSRLNPVPSVYLYSVLVQLLSPLRDAVDVTLVLYYVCMYACKYLYSG